jgi:hypothetical protein
MVQSKRKTIYTPGIGGKKSTAKTDQITLCDVCGEQINYDPDITKNLYKCNVCGKDVCFKCSKQFLFAHARSVCRYCDQKNPELVIKLRNIVYLSNAKGELTNLSIVMENDYERSKKAMRG